ncbi:MAG: hypothetical protein Q7V10_05520 [Methanobacteriaceae archaeon]|nr:hypothetical protein [Methanobacteriaceae archaeon]MDO9627748.1 hypothetical protein [Methanobacteriaceae archaeon]
MSEIVILLLEIVPISLAAAISPTSFALLIVLLSLSKRPKTSGGWFFTGINTDDLDSSFVRHGNC